jgi:hypothetical protein
MYIIYRVISCLLLSYLLLFHLLIKISIFKSRLIITSKNILIKLGPYSFVSRHLRRRLYLSPLWTWAVNGNSQVSEAEVICYDANGTYLQFSLSSDSTGGGFFDIS